MGFLGFRCALWFVIASELLAPVLNHFFPFAQALSTRLGYGLPALLARALAACFCDAVNGVDFFLGFFVSQNSFFFFILTPLGILRFVARSVRLTLHHMFFLGQGRCDGRQWWL